MVFVNNIYFIFKKGNNPPISINMKIITKLAGTTSLVPVSKQQNNNYWYLVKYQSNITQFVPVLRSYYNSNIKENVYQRKVVFMNNIYSVEYIKIYFKLEIQLEVCWEPHGNEKLLYLHNSLNWFTILL